MTFDSQPITDQDLDAYLDGQLEPQELEAFEQRLRAHPEVQREVQRYAALDDSVKRLFPAEQASETQIHDLSAGGTNRLPTEVYSAPQPPWHRGAIRAALIGLAATLAWVLVIWQFKDPTAETPFFESQPVSLVYQEVLDDGFEPYYECRDDKRFADTFLRRQGQALSLATLPPGSHMLGLSYAGGLSRDTTAMLCRVDGQPVMVFVDRLENDQPIASQIEGSEIKIHRVARGGLVFYEVTPFDASRVIKHLVPQEVDASRG